MIGALFMLALRQAAAPRRAVFLALLALLPLGLAALIRALANIDGGELIGGVLEGLVVNIVLPLVVMVLATSAFGNEVEDRTLSLLTTKPVPALEHCACQADSDNHRGCAPADCSFGGCDHDGPGRQRKSSGGPRPQGRWLGVVTYASAFTWAGLLTTRALGFGLIYVLLWEAIITGFLEGARYLSVRSYTQGTMHGLDDTTFNEALAIDLQAALIGAALVTALFFFLSVRRLSRMDVP